MYTIFELDRKFYAVEYDAENNQVMSIGGDSPRNGGRWIASTTDAGIKYVASPCSTRAAARSRIYRQRKRDDGCRA